MPEAPMSGNGSLFAAAIEDHLALKRRNSKLDADLPLDQFIAADPFTNHPLFKSEDQARREEEETGDHPAIELADTAALPAVDGTSEPASWMDTATVPDFRWD
jgi:hypothetical protein